MITREEILKGQECLTEYEANLADLLIKLNKFREIYGKPMIVTSGYRPLFHNIRVGGAMRSAHRYCMAADFSDREGALKAFIDASPKVVENGILVPKVLIQCGLYMESPEATPTWVHLQTRPTKSRVFRP